MDADDELAARLALVDAETEAVVAGLSRRADDALGAAADRKTRLVWEAGRLVCPRCRGAGAVTRLDAGYMRRFGMRDWNGCADCGGDGQEQRGRGFV